VKALIAAVALILASSAAAGVYDVGGPRTTNNDDGCDIALLPAATLLLPYFEVDLDDPNHATTLFSVTNVGSTEQVAHVTLWTDMGYPVIAFDLYLTGYDVQSVNLYDVIKLGQIAPARGTGTTVSPEGDFSSGNPTLDLIACERIPPEVAPALVARMRAAFTGRPSTIDGCRVSLGHSNATGYATIDVVSACNSQLTPADPGYYEGILRYDNVLMGDYMHVTRRLNLAQGSPMVHIRAIPEGGTAASRAADPLRSSVNFPRTFYGRFLRGTSKVTDARQPLPSRFAARWIDTPFGSVETELVIWREGRRVTGTCSDYLSRPSTESVTFDEDENANASYFVNFRLPSAVRMNIVEETAFAARPHGSEAGWIYLNLDDPDEEGATQAWVVSSMRGGGFSVEADALALGNGCSFQEELSEIYRQGGIVIGPSGNTNP
jgi:hypothetical protein